MKAILQKEWHGYFSTVTGYLFTAFLMLFAGIFFSVFCLTGGLPSLEYVLSFAHRKNTFTIFFPPLMFGNDFAVLANFDPVDVQSALHFPKTKPM